jgi:hypothetical protein
MPKVGSKHFAYTKQGQKQAQQYARQTGQKVAAKQPPKKK